MGSVWFRGQLFPAHGDDLIITRAEAVSSTHVTSQKLPLIKNECGSCYNRWLTAEVQSWFCPSCSGYQHLMPLHHTWKRATTLCGS